MKKYFMIFGLVLILSFQVLNASEFKRKMISVDVSKVNKETMINFLQLGLDIVNYKTADNTLELIIHSKEELNSIEELPVRTEVILDDIDSYSESLKQQGYLDNFHTYDQMLTELEAIEAAHPDIAKLYDIGNSWEKQRGIADRDIWAMKISDNVQQEERCECEVLYIANHHAREIITPEILMYFINYLVDNYGIDDKVTYIVNNRQLWLIPMMNPDGHNYVFTTDMWWRKNRRNNGDGSYGVDLNRNWGYAWGYDNSGSSPYPWSETYRGTEPFSEPETQAVRDLALDHKFIISLSYHSYSQLILYPWGYIRQRAPDHEILAEIADSIVAYNHYTPQAAWELYIVNGGSDDWLYGEQTQKNKIYAFTPEVGTRFHPDTSTIMREILENLGPNLFVAYAADRYSPLHQITHTPLSDTQDPVGPYWVTATITPYCVRLDTSKLFLHFNTTGIAPFDSLVLIPTGNADEYLADIQGFGDNVTIYYYFSAKDEISRPVYSPAGAPQALYSFDVQPDMIPPAIVHIPLEDQCQYLDKFLIEAEVTDNFGIAQVDLLFRLNGGEINTAHLTIDSSSNSHQACIPANVDSGDVIDYKIIATDRARVPNQASHPDSGFHSFKIIDHIIFTFENNDGKFIGSDPDWEWGAPLFGPDSAYSGINVWATNLAGNYADSSQIFLDSPVISLKNFPRARLEFYHYYDFESNAGKYWDGGNVKISEDNGQNWILITPLFGYPCDSIFALTEPGYGAKSGAWIYDEFDLNSYLGKEILIRFHFGSDFQNNEAGWYVDDIAIRPEFVTLIENDQNEITAELPVEYSLSQNYPNPFNPETTINYQIPKDGWVAIKIYNLLGQIVVTLVDEHQKAGRYHIGWNGTDQGGKQLTAGIYFYSIKSGNFYQTKKMILLP